MGDTTTTQVIEILPASDTTLTVISGTSTITASAAVLTVTPAAIVDPPPPPPPPPPPSTIKITIPPLMLAGTPCIVLITTTPPLASIDAVAVSAATLKWYGGAKTYTEVPLVNGSGSLTVVWLQSGDFLKYGPHGGPYVDSPPVNLIGSPPTSSPATSPGPAAFKAALKMGGNLERWNLPAYQGVRVDQSAAFWAYFKTWGTHVRSFNAWGYDGSQGDSLSGSASPAQFCAMFKLAIAAGVRVRFDALGTVRPGDATSNWPSFQNQLGQTCDAIKAAGLDPSMIVVGGPQEFDGGANADFVADRALIMPFLRSQLPGFTLCDGACNFKYYGGKGALNSFDNANGLCDGSFAPYSSTDTNVLYDFHDYDSWYGKKDSTSVATWAAAQANISAWEMATGLVAMCGEFGPGNSATDYGNIPASLMAAAKGMGGCAPTAWTISSNPGNANLNASPGDATLRAGLADAFIAASAAIGA